MSCDGCGEVPKKGTTLLRQGLVSSPGQPHYIARTGLKIKAPTLVVQALNYKHMAPHMLRKDIFFFLTSCRTPRKGLRCL